MAGSEQSLPVSTANQVVEPTDSGDRRLRLRRRNLRRSSDDVIVIESPLAADTSRAVRRRRRTPRVNDDSIVDLTCTDDVVDLTSPDLLTPEPSAFEISDEELPASGISPVNTVEEPESSPLSSLACPVCLEKFSKIVKGRGQIMSTICGHVFCNECIRTALYHSKKCPTCRKKLDARKVHALYLPI